MKAKRIALTLAAAALALSCGEGKAIFNVDVYSFMTGTGSDTVHYTLPPSVSGNFDVPPIQVSLVQGIGKAVDTVSLQAAAALVNALGGGTANFQVFFASDSASTYAGPPYIDASGTAGPGATTDTLKANVVFNNNLFSQDKLWVGIRLAASSGASGMDGTMKLSALTLHIVLEDNKGF
ncbi:MAG TPA: hypothetical protein VFK78_02210 [Gemmatimonadales bacterium]|nr:hypothetical protein [Gemmatimonadales bacterium]